ncbi:MAG TPA: methyl-accepting chemotaxis protein, partial [Archangium sp.]|nr:methyl-accepting chemotaxis protein [Archangium sp.]
MGLNKQESITILLYVVPVAAVLFTAVVPYLIIRRAVWRAFSELPGDGPSSRLERILKVPTIVAATLIVCTPFGVSLIVGSSVILFGRNPLIILWSVITVALHVMLMMMVEQIAVERQFSPYAIREFHRTGGVSPKGQGLLWPRQSWYLPYAFAVFVACTLATTLTVVGRQGYDMFTFLMEQSQTQSMNAALFKQILQESVSTVLRNSILPITVLGGYLVGIATVTAWLLARRQREGAQSVQGTLEGLANGNPQLPNWISTDEIGDLAAASARVFEQLRSFSLSLRESALSLQRSAQQLGTSTTKQTEVLSVQAAALQETQVTTEEITQTSQLAAKTANNILKQAERAQDISQSGEVAIQEGMAGLEEIGVQVQEMATSIKSLDEQARQIARITSMVKDLADQSNMLALNAAIEAVR